MAHRTAMSDETTADERRTALETHYRGVAALAEKKPLTVAATDLRHALGMDSPAGSLSKTVLARSLAIVDDDEETPADALEAMHTAEELRERAAKTFELEAKPTSLGPIVYTLLARVEKASDEENIGDLAVKNSDEEEEYKESYYEKLEVDDDE